MKMALLRRDMLQDKHRKVRKQCSVTSGGLGHVKLSGDSKACSSGGQIAALKWLVGRMLQKARLLIDVMVGSSMFLCPT